VDVIAELEKSARKAQRMNWAAELAARGLAVVSSREIGTVPAGRPLRLATIAVYRYDEETNRKYHYGSIIDSGYFLKTISTRKTEIVRCHHLELEDTRDGLVFFSCPECHEFPDPNSWISRRAIKIIRPDIDPEEPWKQSGLWKDKRHTKIPWNLREHESGFEYAEHFAGGTNVQLLRRRLRQGRSWAGHPGGFLAPVRRTITLDGAVAPEIDQRRLNAAWSYVLGNPDFYEYRAPYSKVREMREAGFSIPQMAKRLKVSERTIDNRLIDVPDTLPRADVLALRVKASGGYMRPAFWPGADSIPRGDTRTVPSALERPLNTLTGPTKAARYGQVLPPKVTAQSTAYSFTDMPK
jgi:hypothetical protein